MKIGQKDTAARPTLTKPPVTRLNCCELSQDEIQVIAEHENLPETVASRYGRMLLGTANGIRVIERYIDDSIMEAEARDEADKTERLRKLLARFQARFSKDHPEDPAA